MEAGALEFHSEFKIMVSLHKVFGVVGQACVRLISQRFYVIMASPAFIKFIIVEIQVTTDIPSFGYLFQFPPEKGHFQVEERRAVENMIQGKISHQVRRPHLVSRFRGNPRTPTSVFRVIPVIFEKCCEMSFWRELSRNFEEKFREF